MYVCMYMQYIQGLCQSRLSTENHAPLLIAPATTAVYSFDRLYVVPLLLHARMLRALPSNGHCLQSHLLARGRHATV
jgi:hypothetical protein